MSLRAASKTLPQNTHTYTYIHTYIRACIHANSAGQKRERQLYPSWLAFGLTRSLKELPLSTLPTKLTPSETQELSGKRLLSPIPQVKKPRLRGSQVACLETFLSQSFADI